MYSTAIMIPSRQCHNPPHARPAQLLTLKSETSTGVASEPVPDRALTTWARLLSRASPAPALKAVCWRTERHAFYAPTPAACGNALRCVSAGQQAGAALPEPMPITSTPNRSQKEKDCRHSHGDRSGIGPAGVVGAAAMPCPNAGRTTTAPGAGSSADPASKGT